MADAVVERGALAGTVEAPQPRASLVETIPFGMDDLHIAGNESTAEALIRLVDAAENTIDLTALYWSLRANVNSDEDMRGWTVAELLADFGAQRGAALYASLDAAATRGVRIRIVESPGFDEPGVERESAVLLAAHPDNVDIRSIRVEDWFGSGIMHQKLWVVDRRSVYVGSANNDWRSLAQVKELGVLIEDAPDVAADAARYFETWWSFTQLEPTADNTAVVFDAESQVERRVPAWSSLVLAELRAPNPLEREDRTATQTEEHPIRVHLNGEEGHLVLSGAPREVCVGGRPFDGDLIASTILDATTTVCVNVMDFAPVSIYRPTQPTSDDAPASPVWWPALFDALLQAVSTKRVHARLLVSEWEHTSPYIGPYLEALDAAARAASANLRMTAGTLEIRRFRVPGWQETGPKTDLVPTRYPGHTRVNHVKYVVTDRRANIGTSNMTWDYFSATAGTSVNASHRPLVEALQALFDRDWRSAYAFPIG